MLPTLAAEARGDSGAAGSSGAELPRGPVPEAGYPVWAARAGAVEVRFVGRGAAGSRSEILERIEGRRRPVAAARQIHSDRVLEARPGLCGEGDALWTSRRGLALSVITADCVPVLLARASAEPENGPGPVAAIHAGWRGIEAGVVARTVRALGVPPEALTAWIGPSIGACCYEVSDDVAKRVAGASHAAVVVPGPGERPHLDLPGAVRHQLLQAGIAAPRIVVRCTRCDAETLWSYRREGKGAGRNVAFIWIR